MFPQSRVGITLLGVVTVVGGIVFAPIWIPFFLNL